MTSFDCPKCGAKDKGVLLFNLVAECDNCLNPVKPGIKWHTVPVEDIQNYKWLWIWAMTYEFCESERVYWESQITGFSLTKVGLIVTAGSMSSAAYTVDPTTTPPPNCKYALAISL